GTVWEERFKSVLVEGAGQSAQGPGGLAAVAAYIDLNAVRAGLVDDPAKYRWSSYGEAVAGDAEAREGLAVCLGEPGAWRWGQQRIWGEFFQARRELFSAGRKSAARKMRGAEWGELRSAQDLRSGGIDPH
ncbi:MAG TPA: hypothetical protein VMN36_09245, partial [Verrucomicrobiales bacterium]|nr:hypothetical protein [Verrucomicrobiales bacterium]